MSGLAPASDCAMAPRKLPRRLRSSPLPGPVARPGERPRLTQCMPCWAARMANAIRVFSLSPFTAWEFVKPAAIFSCHRRLSAQAFDVASANVLNGADGLPMYVGAPKIMASARSKVAQRSSVSSATLSRSTWVPGTEAAPRATAFACWAV
jgi:hypothetical protein